MFDSGIPKYLCIKQSILQSINNGILKVGELVPSERELIDTYSVSRITIRKALSELETEGYIYKVQGKGTYVKRNQKNQNLFSLTSCTQDIIRLGMSPTRKVLSSEIKTADRKRQNILGLKADEKVFSLSRVYFADDDAINFTTTYLPYKYVPGIEDFDFSKASLYDVVENKYDIVITRAVRTVQAVIASDEVCKLLSVKKGVPLLLFQCKTFGKVKDKEVPIEALKCYYRSDKYDFFINQVR